MRISDWSSDVCSSDLFLVSISGRAPFLARWVITEEQLILREDQGGERAGVSDADRRRLVFGVTERRADALVVAPLSLFGMGVSMRTSAKSASFEFAGVTRSTESRVGKEGDSTF